MHIPIYIINLDRSKERFEMVSLSAKVAGLDAFRVSAYDGNTINLDECHELDEKAFRRRHGKNVMPGEVGCYLSHLHALCSIAKGNSAYAIIVEDDVLFPDDFSSIIEKIVSYEGWDVVKLYNHRNRLFHEYAKLDERLSMGRFLHGPLGSAACYLVSKEGAAKLCEKLVPMSLPYDVALERGWTGFNFFSLNENVISLHYVSKSSISQGRSSYKKNKLPKWKRIATLLFRINDYFLRMIYGIKPAKLERKKTL